MSDLIDREALLKRLHDAGGCGAPPESWADGYDKAIDLAYGMAENAPTIDPVHAAAEALGMSPDRLRELAQAEKEGRLVVLEHAAKKGEKKPPCFYNDMGQEFCLGLARGECDDEPIDRCKECWYCESTREAAEAALDAMGGENNA